MNRPHPVQSVLASLAAAFMFSWLATPAPALCIAEDAGETKGWTNARGDLWHGVEVVLERVDELVVIDPTLPRELTQNSVESKSLDL